VKKFFIQMRGGGEFDPKTGEISRIEIADIAHALSHMCRYAGHCSSMYSVAEHSVLVSRIIRQMWPDDVMARWAGLLHDATEAYVCDLPTPLKVLLPEFMRIEDELAVKIALKFGIQWTEEVTRRVKQADAIALSTEARLLFEDVSQWDSIKPYAPIPTLLHWAFPQDSLMAREYFLNEFAKVEQEVGSFSTVKTPLSGG
jgi:5'-deoxynucleotidase YfbR-like HD superfamily hydrolase